MKEVWKPIEGFNERYWVSNLGRIKTTYFYMKGQKVDREKIMTPCASIRGHGRIKIRLKTSKHHRVQYAVDRFVYNAFSGEKLNKTDILMHKDGDFTNCRIDNLYVMTRSEWLKNEYDKDNRWRLKHEYYEEILPVKEIAKRNNMKEADIRHRMKVYGWNIYEAAEIPKRIF